MSSDTAIKDFLDRDKQTYCFDMDDVIITHPKGTDSGPLFKIFMRLQVYRKSKKVTWQEAWRKLKIDKSDVDKCVEYMLNSHQLNPHLLKFIDQLKKEEIQTVLASNNNAYIVDAVMRHFQLEYAFDFIHLPENNGWFWKPNKNYYLTLKKKLNNKSFDKIILFDDDPKNIETLNNLGGIGVLYKKGQKFQKI